MKDQLKKEQILTQTNYLGITQYEMANGQVDSCRRYTVDNIKVGKYSVKNVTVAVTEKGKKILIGRSLLNKFTYWILDNKAEKLVLVR